MSVVGKYLLVLWISIVQIRITQQMLKNYDNKCSQQGIKETAQVHTCYKVVSNHDGPGVNYKVE
jgi:hypothetical protein